MLLLTGGICGYELRSYTKLILFSDCNQPYARNEYTSHHEF